MTITLIFPNGIFPPLYNHFVTLSFRSLVCFLPFILSFVCVCVCVCVCVGLAFLCLTEAVGRQVSLHMGCRAFDGSAMCEGKDGL